MSIKRRRIFLFTLLGAASLFFLLEGNFLKNSRTSPDSDDSFVVLARAINLIKNEYIEEPSTETTMEGAYRGMVNSLDIRSSYLNKKNTEKYKQLYGTPANETGLVLYKTPHSFPVIIGIKENSPAEKSGLELGDTIGSIEGQSTLEMSMIESNLAQKNNKPDSVLIKVLKREKDEEVKVKREMVNKSFYSFKSQEGTGGILKIHALFPPCVEEIKKKVVPKLLNNKQPLIIDFRYCDQGTLEEATSLINIFLQKKNIGYIETKENKKEQVSCLDEAMLPEIPLFIWTNQSTLGASEAAASVLNKFRDAKTIGTKTLGLMSEEKLFLLKDGSGIVLPTGIFHPFSIAQSWNQGINPDTTLKSSDLSFSAYLEATLKSLSETPLN